MVNDLATELDLHICARRPFLVLGWIVRGRFGVTRIIIRELSIHIVFKYLPSELKDDVFESQATVANEVLQFDDLVFNHFQVIFGDKLDALPQLENLIELYVQSLLWCRWVRH